MLVTDDDGFFACADELPYEPIHADDFFVLLDDAVPLDVREMTLKQLIHWNQRGVVPPLAEKLRQASCPGFAGRITRRMAELSGPHAVRRLDASAFER